jgi:hypothetical protein
MLCWHDEATAGSEEEGEVKGHARYHCSKKIQNIKNMKYKNIKIKNVQKLKLNNNLSPRALSLSLSFCLILTHSLSFNITVVLWHYS